MMGGEQNRPSARAALVSCLALALAACELLQPAAAPPPPEPLATPVAVTRLPSPPPRKPHAPPEPSLARLPPAAETETEPQPQAPPAIPAGSFDQLVGLDQPHVSALLGNPDTRADAPPATIWRYGGTTCDADIYFYLDLQSQTMRALHYEVRSHDLSDRSVQRCYDALASERHAHAESAAGTDRPR